MLLAGCFCQLADYSFQIKFHQFPAAQTIQVPVRFAGNPVIAGDAVADIDFPRQANFTNQLQIPPDRAIADRFVYGPDFVVELIDRDVLAQFKERAENQLSLGRHFVAFGS